MSEEYPKKDEGIPFVDLREGARGILTWAQVDGDQLAPVALELIGEARRLAEKLDEDSRMVYTVIIGKKVSHYTETLIHHGADEVYVVEDERLEDYMTLPYTSAMIKIIKEVNPEIAIFSASSLGRDLAPRVAAILNLGLSADCTAFDIGYYANRRRNQRFKKVFKMIRPSFGESKLATIIGPWSYPQTGTARPGVFEALPADTSRKGEIKIIDPQWKEDDFKIELLETFRDPDAIDLTKADVIVAGGLGVKKEHWPLLRELVDAINANGQRAELGASRAAVDEGNASYDYQIGQTGKTVRPAIYIAIGISGAIQHLAGMKESAQIIAINNDPEANILGNANYAIIDDYINVLPEMIKQVKDGYLFPTEKGLTL